MIEQMDSPRSDLDLAVNLGTSLGTDLDPARLAGILSPLRRALLTASRAAHDLPDIPDAQIQVIRALPAGESRAPSDLADELRLDRSTISNLLASMQRSGLIERRPDPSDGRRALVSTSARARSIFASFDAASARILGEALGVLDPTDRMAVAAAVPALERLLSALIADPGSADADPDPATTAENGAHHAASHPAT